MFSERLVIEAARKTPGGFPGTRQEWVFPKENKEQIQVNGLAQEKERQPCRVMGAEPEERLMQERALKSILRKFRWPRASLRITG